MRLNSDGSEVKLQKQKKRPRRPRKITKVAKGTMSLMQKSFKSVQRAGGKVTKRIGFNISEEQYRQLLKKKQDLEMAKLKKGGEHTKEALEFIFCMFNEHELFGVIERLI